MTGIELLLWAAMLALAAFGCADAWLSPRPQPIRTTNS